MTFASRATHGRLNHHGCVRSGIYTEVNVRAVRVGVIVGAGQFDFRAKTPLLLKFRLKIFRRLAKRGVMVSLAGPNGRSLRSRQKCFQAMRQRFRLRRSSVDISIVPNRAARPRVTWKTTFATP